MNPASATPSGDEAHVIKKYPNRRLYDTKTSTYITLADIKQLVMASEEFVVRDAKSSEDLTRSILLQIILEEEAGGSPMFTTAVLASIIRFYGHAMQGLMGGYLEKNLQTFMSLQPSLMQNMVSSNLEQSKALMAQMQEQMQKQTEQMLQTFGVKR